MARVHLHSTSLHTATYHDKSALLELEFRSGATYRYFGVPTQTWQELLRAESRGRYFNQHIRNHFAWAKADPGTAAQLAIPDSTTDPG